MELIQKTLVIDFITGLWVSNIFLILLLLLPLKSFNLALKEITKGKIVGIWLRTMLVAIAGVLVLSYGNLLNWLTLSLLYSFCLICNYLESYNWRIKYCQQELQSKVLKLIDVFDRGVSFANFLKNVAQSIQRVSQQLASYANYLILRHGIVLIILLTIVVSFAVLLRWEYPLLELRFTHPDHYGVLLATRQILAGSYPETNSIAVFPALAAFISLLASLDAMEAIRFLSPLIGIILVLSVGYSIKILTNYAAAALVAMLAIGIYIFTWTGEINPDVPQGIFPLVNSLNASLIRQWAVNHWELASIFLLLGLAYYFEPNSNRLNLICSLILIAITAPPFLILVAIASVGVMGGKKFAFITLTLTWLALAVVAAIAQSNPELPLVWMQGFLFTLPIPLSLSLGMMVSGIFPHESTASTKRVETFCLVLLFCLILNFALPLKPNITYLEYDLAARKSLELNRLFAPFTWTLVAPVEQLAEIYGYGNYQDLALFVETYAELVAQPQFEFPTSSKHLFLMVEKIPFVTFPQQQGVVSNEILSDRTYRYYRSTSGRASLQYEALKMAETYLLHHPNSEIYYEDGELRIYHFLITPTNS